VRGSAKKRKVIVACGDAVTAVEVVGQSTKWQLSWPQAQAMSWARLGKVEAEVAVIDEESTMRFGVRRRWCCEPGLLETLDVRAGTGKRCPGSSAGGEEGVGGCRGGSITRL
jgi:hypothetical protein